MINLLPTDSKQSIRYARRNTELRKWSVALMVSVLVIIGIIGAGHLYLENSIKAHEKLTADGNAQLELQNLTETQKTVKDLSNNLKLVVQVLEREILFSELLRQIGSVLPSGSVLTDLSIIEVRGGIDLSAAAIDFQTATQVQLNIQDPSNKIFDKVDLINVQCANPDPVSAQSEYPCTITLRALFASDNTFSFVNTGTSR